MIGVTWFDAPDIGSNRSFVLRGLPDIERATEIIWIDQGYLPFTMSNREMEWAAGGRIRRLLRRNGECECDLKQHRGTDRITLNEISPIHEMVFSKLWEDAEGLTFRKTRYLIKLKAHLWYIESIAELGLFMARLHSLEDDVARVEVPNWLRSMVMREVTEEPGYRSIDFAHRLRRWREVREQASAG